MVSRSSYGNHNPFIYSISHDLAQYISRSSPANLLRCVFPSFSSAHIKITVFITLLIYAAAKLRYLTPGNRYLFRTADCGWLISILVFKNIYHASRLPPRSDTRNLLPLALLMLLSMVSGGKTAHRLREDFFFAASGVVVSAYFML
eukprot:gb/GECH01004308.1/.p1 GENE.gb/GECH01004308.1/~~gb/GECH01004308.1/.p1  ORF type:complete len:146 (+),score=6.31 gb/GECH01004308.1/:1-438(+)